MVGNEKINSQDNHQGADLLVVGGGIAGMTAAIEASELGKRVILVEREPTVGGRVATSKFYFPKLNDPVKFSEFIKQQHSGNLFIAHCANNEKMLLKNVVKPQTETTMLIGPEGDFSLNEIKQSLEHKFIPVSLGESRLRTETAGIVAVHSLAFINE